MRALAEFGKSLMAFTNLCTVLIFFQAAWQDANVNIALSGCLMWFLFHFIAFGLIAFANRQEKMI